MRERDGVSCVYLVMKLVYIRVTVRERDRVSCVYLVMKPWGRWVKGRTNRFRRGSSQEAQRAAARSPATLFASPGEENGEDEGAQGERHVC